MIVYDQVPVSVRNEITVSPVTLSGGVLDDQTGKITWNLDLKSQEQKDLKFQYEVKYPKNQRVILE